MKKILTSLALAPALTAGCMSNPGGLVGGGIKNTPVRSDAHNLITYEFNAPNSGIKDDPSTLAALAQSMATPSGPNHPEYLHVSTWFIGLVFLGILALAGGFAYYCYHTRRASNQKDVELAKQQDESQKKMEEERKAEKSAHAAERQRLMDQIAAIQFQMTQFQVQSAQQPVQQTSHLVKNSVPAIPFVATAPPATYNQ